MHSIPAYITEPAGVSRQRWPITAGVPFPQGQVRSLNQISLHTAGQPAACHWDVRARWPDGSVRWALLDTQVGVEASDRTECLIHYGSDITSVMASQPSALQVAITAESIDIDTGVAGISIGRSGRRLFTALSVGGRGLLGDDTEPQLTATEIAGATPFHGEIEEAVVEEQNSMRAVVRLDGHYVSEAGQTLLSWTIRIQFYSNHSFIKLYHTITHDQPTHSTVRLGSLRLSIPIQVEKENRRVLLGSVAATDARSGPRRQRDPAAQEMRAPVASLQTRPGRHQVSGLAADDTATQVREENSFGWLHLCDARIGVTIKLIRPWQNSPTAVSTDGERLNLHLYPDLTHPDLTSMGSTPLPDVELLQGVAKTHELALHIGPPCSRFLAADRIAIGLEHPPLLSLPAAHWAQTGVFGSFQPFAADYWTLESKLRSWSRVPTDYGFLPFGGCADSDDETFGLARSLLIQYLRTDDQSLFWRAQALLLHSMDAGTCHFHSDHPEWVGGSYRPGQIGSAAPSPEFARLDGLVDFYFLTGYRRAREVAESCADFCRRTAPYDWREAIAGDGIAGFGALAQVGNALNVMGGFFAAFSEPRFLRSMEALVDLLEIWQDHEGRWSHPTGLHREGAEPALTASVLEGLTHYYTASGDERARRMVTDGALYLVRHGRTAEGLFFQQQFHPDQRPCPRALALLPILNEEFEHSGDWELLDAGHRMFRWAVDTDRVTAAHLKDLIAFMPLLDKMKLLNDYSGPADAAPRIRELWPHSVISADS